MAVGQPVPAYGGNRSSVLTFLQDRRFLYGAVTLFLLFFLYRANGPAPAVEGEGGASFDTGGSVRGKGGATNLEGGSSLPVINAKFQPTPGSINAPHGGKLVDLLASPERARQLVTEIAPKVKSWTMSMRQLCDIEVMIGGGFSPLDGFMDKATYTSVVNDMRLGPKYDNKLFPMPITLDVSEDFASTVTVGEQIALRDQYYNLIAIMTIKDKWTPNKPDEAQKVFRTTDPSHPAVDYLYNMAGPVYLGGSVEANQLPIHYDFKELRYTPKELRARLHKLNWSKALGFQTRNPMHRAHIEVTRLAAAETGAGVILHPVVGMTKPGDVNYNVRVRCYKQIIDSHRYYLRDGVILSLLPLAMRMAGPREALWHAIIRKNYGASHFIIGRDHAGCKSSAGEDFYGAYDAQELVNSVKDELGIGIVPLKKVVYVESQDRYLPQDQVPDNVKTLSISGTKFRGMMNAGSPIPAWFSDPGVIEILQKVAPPREKRGFAVFFTGLSGGGKTTITHALLARLYELIPTRHLTVLDGDVVRTHLSKELGFSVKDRNTNVARMGFVASEAVRHGGVVVASTIAPFEKARSECRSLVEAAGGGFVLVHVSTSAAECAARDVKGLYAKASAGEIALTGVSHPYEYPEKPDLTIDAGVVPVETSVNLILSWLNKEGYLTEDIVGSAVAGMDLTGGGFLSTGVEDPISRSCKRRGGNGGSTRPRVVIVVAPTFQGVQTASGEAFAEAIKGDFASVWRGAVNTFAEKHPVPAKDSTSPSDKSGSLITITSKNMREATEKVLRANGVSTMPADNSALYGLVTEDDRPEIAWELWNSIRDTSATGDAKSAGWIKKIESIPSAPGHVLASAPSEVLPFLPTILREDPCASAIIVGGDGGAGGQLWDEYTTSAKVLREKFPIRVAVVDKEGQTMLPDGASDKAATADKVLQG